MNTVTSRTWSIASKSGKPFPQDSTKAAGEVPLATAPIVLAVGCFLVTFVPFLHLGNLDARYFLAGGICAATSHGIMTPLDVIKTRIQASPLEFQDGFWHATKTILQTEGSSVLKRGLGPTVIGYGVEGAAKFGIYESLKPIMTACLPTDNTALPFLLGSILAGGTASLILCPLERLRIRLVTDDSFRNSNSLSGLMSMIQEEGFLSVFGGGFSAMLSKQLPYTVGKQVSFDIFAASLHSSYILKDFHAVLFAAFGASLIACLLSQPGDVLLTKTYQESTRGEKIPSLSQTAHSLWIHQGPCGFLSGLSARFVHVGSIVPIQLVLFDIVKQSLGLPATGSA